MKEQISAEQMLACHTQAHAEVVRVAVQFKGDASTLRGRLMKDLTVILCQGQSGAGHPQHHVCASCLLDGGHSRSASVCGLGEGEVRKFPESIFSGISFIVILLLRLIYNFLVCSDINSAEGFSIELLEMAVDRLGPAAE